MVTCNYLPFDQVCEIIAEQAVAYAGPKQLNWTEDFRKQERLLIRFGHALWRALEEEHLKHPRTITVVIPDEARKRT